MSEDFSLSLAKAVVAAGGRLDPVAERRGLARSTVAAAARRYGWPDMDEMRSRTGEAVNGVAALLRRVAAVRSHMPPAALEGWREAVDRLAVAVAAAEKEHAATAAADAALAAKRVEVEQMRARAARAEAELAALEGATPPPPAAAEVTPAEIRRWAADMRIDCPRTGKIPRRVRDAYDARPQP